MNLEEYQKQRLNSHHDMHSVQLKQAEFILKALSDNQENVSNESPPGLTYS